MTDEALRVLKLLHGEGNSGKIVASRVFPFAHKFKLDRSPGSSVVVTLSTIDQLVRAKYIATPTGVMPIPTHVAALDRYYYTITDEGRQAVDDHAAQAAVKRRNRDRRK